MVQDDQRASRREALQTLDLRLAVHGDNASEGIARLKPYTQGQRENDGRAPSL